jgi:hypothetical protein
MMTTNSETKVHRRYFSIKNGHVKYFSIHILNFHRRSKEYGGILFLFMGVTWQLLRSFVRLGKIFSPYACTQNHYPHPFHFSFTHHRKRIRIAIIQKELYSEQGGTPYCIDWYASSIRRKECEAGVKHCPHYLQYNFRASLLVCHRSDSQKRHTIFNDTSTTIWSPRR